MIENVEAPYGDNVKPQEGIGLFKIRYEMDVANSTRDNAYIVGILAYTSKEAVDTLVAFCKRKVKGFKGMRIDEVAFEGLVHDVSDNVRGALLKTAILQGEVVPKADYEAALADAQKKTKKQAIIPKDKKE